MADTARCRHGRAGAALSVMILAAVAAHPAAAVTQETVDGWASTLSTDLHTFNEQAAAFSVLQSAFEAADYNPNSVTGQDAFDRLQTALESKVAARTAAVNAIHAAASAAEASAGGQSDTAPQCCSTPTTDNDYVQEFRAPVLLDSTCNRFPYSEEHADAAMQTTAGKTVGLLDTYESNFATTPELKWQYYGSDTGAFRVFPAKDRGSCCDYDPRFRPWYVAAAVPEPKDVVVVIDSSGSMSSEGRMSKAKAAAKVVLSTVNPRDRVAVVDFDSTASSPGGCMSTELAEATPRNLATMKTFVDSMHDSGGTAYVAALAKSFDLLDNAEDLGADRKKVILFLSDGEPNESDADILGTLSDRNTGRRVHVLTFLLGDADAAGILTSMATQNNGRFVHIPDSGDLRTAMGEYYDFFSEPVPGQEPIWSAPYFDASGLGLMTTAALPVYSGSTLKGVVGVDVTIEDLAAEVNFVGESSEKSYAFIIDSEGRVMMHPLMPSPTAVHEPPIFMHVTQLETNAEFADTVLPSMLAGESGSESVTVTRAVTRGVTSDEGLRTVTFPANYLWGPIEGSPFRVCLVFVRDTVLQMEGVTAPADLDTLNYHRVDVASDPGTLCNQFGAVASVSKSTVKLAPSTFQDPVRYMESKESAATADAMTAWLRGEGASPVSLVDGGTKERMDAWVTAGADAAYIANADDVMGSIVWRYVGTARGVFRTYPGHQSASTYDPRLRPWYLRSNAHENELAFSTPYFDASGAGVVVTMSRAIRQSGNEGAIEAVTGVDFSLGKFQQFLDDATDCESGDFVCAIVDSSGLIVLSNELLLEEYDRCVGTDTAFLGDQFPGVANFLIGMSTPALKQSLCNDFQNIQQERAWVLDTDGQSVVGDVVSADDFVLSPIPGTNAYMLVQEEASWTTTKFTASQQQTNPILMSSAFDTCTTTFSLTSEAAERPTCPPELSNALVTIIPPGTEGVLADSLGECYPDRFCFVKDSPKVCAETVGCAVCYDSSNRFECRIGSCDADNAGHTQPCNPDNGGGSGSGVCLAPGAAAGLRDGSLGLAAASVLALVAAAAAAAVAAREEL